MSMHVEQMQGMAQAQAIAAGHCYYCGAWISRELMMVHLQQRSLFVPQRIAWYQQQQSPSLYEQQLLAMRSVCTKTT